jgi:DNA-binding NarL/FixJ family response regulator
MTQSTQAAFKHSVFIVDDHPIVRRGLMDVINETADLVVCGEAADVPEALRRIATTRPHLVIVDITLGDEDGIELIDYIKSRWPSMKILVSSAHDEDTFAGRVLRAGALGFISKREPLPQVVEAVRQVLRGDVYLSPHMATCLLQRAANGQPLDKDPVHTLSNRELQVFQLIGEGFTTREIAQRLGISPKTVESHRLALKQKLNTPSISHLRRRAFEWIHDHH